MERSAIARTDGHTVVVPDLPIGAHGPENQPAAGSPAFAPLIFNAWYAIALRRDVGPELHAIKVLGEPLLYYRAEDGGPVVLEDRCAHRRFPYGRFGLKMRRILADIKANEFRGAAT